MVQVAFAQTNTFPDTGNAGIGILTPSGLFEIKGTGNRASIKFGGNSADAHHVSSARDIVFNADGAGNPTTFNRLFTFRNTAYSNPNSYTDLLIINADGAVGIGTTSMGSYKLAVAGSIGAWKEVRVFQIGTNFPDYVFEKDYKLTPLNEVEQYIKANKHLPEVPSAQEIGKEGMSLSDMNILLLKKVEELTLHAIAQEKRMQALEEQLKALKK